MWSSTFPWGTSSDLSRRALQAKPNPAHDVIAKMSVPSYLKQVAPDAESFHLITQNIDRLSVTALNVLVESLPPESAATSDSSRKSAVFQNTILEMHGRIYDVKCTVCDYCAEDRTHPLCPALGAADASLKDYHDAGAKEINIPQEQLPRCPACGALARPGVVWFGETPYYLDEIDSIIHKADMCLVIGTSSTVRLLCTVLFSLTCLSFPGELSIHLRGPRSAPGRREQRRGQSRCLQPGSERGGPGSRLRVRWWM